jgi:fumarate hydratase class II
MAEDTPSRVERDSTGEVAVPAAHYWGAQTQRALENSALVASVCRHPSYGL